MTDRPLLHVRARGALMPDGALMPGKQDEQARPIVEVLKDGEVIGQLPATRAAYEWLPDRLGRLTIEVLVHYVELHAHHAEVSGP